MRGDAVGRCLSLLQHRLKLWQRLRDFEVCVSHREAAPIDGLTRWLYARRLAFDFDDAIFYPAASCKTSCDTRPTACRLWIASTAVFCSRTF